MINKINVLEIVDSFGYAGSQRNMVTFAKHLNKDRFNVYVAGYKEGGVQTKKLDSLNIEYFVGNNTAERIVRFIADKKIDVLHIHRRGKQVMIETSIILDAKRNNPNLIILENNIFGEYDALAYPTIDCSFFQSMMHVNERFLPRSNKELDFSRMRVMYNMVDGEEFKQFKLSKKQILDKKKELGIKQNEFVVGKIARPDVAKWSDLVLEMLPHLVKLNPNIKLILVGVPESRKKVIKKSKYKEKIIIMDELRTDEAVHSFYQIIDVLAHSSKIGECNGNTINEAMFWMKPVVTNSTPQKDNGQLEQVYHMQTGIIANNPQSFAKAIYFLYSDLDIKEDLIQNAYDQIIENNDPYKITKHLERVINEKRLLTDVMDNEVTVPSLKDIIDYKTEYKNSLEWNFYELSFIEKISNMLLVPYKFYFKVHDFIEHKTRKG